jgi:Cdc6-like AAA superfamily ATPase
MERENQPTKVVMDDVDNEGDNDRERDYGNTVITSKFWTVDKKRREDDDGASAENSVVDLPLQPYVKVFDLLKHSFCIIHVGNLTEYAYDVTMIDKLILSDEKKGLVSMLVDGADVSMEDIVKGKTGGIIVIATGPPGTGKTLTAEVFSEQVRRPLYTVQCSQLGTDEKTLETELRIVLSRSQRWKAILLIDEADVYVHERGDDIQQNAIVGVFLRVLEYYRGILFMTSNRETIIDDAIMSRATAWIRYEVPDKEKAKLIWRVLSTQYKAQLSLDQIAELVEHEKFNEISGRTIKNLLKLAKLKSLRNKETITPEMLKYVSQFLDLEGASTRKAA